MNYVRILISVATNRDWPLFQLDVKNAFLHGVLEEEVYMRLPPNFQLSTGKGKMYRLKKALYGLKQSPRAWFKRFRGVMLKIGYRQCHADHTLFVNHQSGKVIALIVYVDDIVVTGDDHYEINHLKGFLGKEFEIKDLGPLKYFLGIEVARSKNGIFLAQRKYVLYLLQDSGMLGCKPCDTPIESNHHMQANESYRLIDVSRYQRLVGKLIYLTLTKPDISYVVGVVSQFMLAPTTRHLEAAYRIVGYLKKSHGQGLLYRKRDDLQVEAFTDADWAGYVDDRRFTSGYCTFIGGNLVSWHSKK